MSIRYLILLVVLVCSGSELLAQSSGIDRYYDEFKSDDRFSEITVSSRMFGLFVNFEMDDPDEQELVDAITKLKGLKMLVGTEIDEAPAIYSKVVKEPESNMDVLMSVDDSRAKFKFFITEANGNISELLMVGYEGTKVLMLSLVGEIDLKQVAKLSQKMNIDGFHHFENVDQ